MTNEIINIILNGLKQAGNYYDCYTMIQEQLPMDEAEEVEQFLAWLDKNDATIGSGNATSRYNEFTRLAPRTKRTFKLEGSKSHKESVARRAKDITTEFVKGNTMHIHSFDYPLKHAVVINYDPASKVITFQL